MQLLLDTHVFLWIGRETSRLSPGTIDILADVDNTLFVSTVSVWEIAVKRAQGRLSYPLEDLDMILAELSLQMLPILPRHAIAAAALPQVHKDPFDRMLVAQAKLEGLTLVTTDHILPRYDVDCFDASR